MRMTQIDTNLFLVKISSLYRPFDIFVLSEISHRKKEMDS